MQFQLTTLTFALLSALTAAAPADIEARQGGYFAAVGYKYSGGGCTSTSLTEADPIFGSGGYCQGLNRFPDANTPPITSYKLSSIAEGCTLRIYQSADCTGTAFTPTVNTCIQANSPFVSSYVSCAWAGTKA